MPCQCLARWERSELERNYEKIVRKKTRADVVPGFLVSGVLAVSALVAGSAT